MNKDKIRYALQCAITLRDTFGGNVGGGVDIFKEALQELDELNYHKVIDEILTQEQCLDISDGNGGHYEQHVVSVEDINHVKDRHK